MDWYEAVFIVIFILAAYYIGFVEGCTTSDRYHENRRDKK